MDICGMALTKRHCTSFISCPQNVVGTSGRGRFVMFAVHLDTASDVIDLMKPVGTTLVRNFVVILMPMMYHMDFKSLHMTTVWRRRPRGDASPIGSLNTGVKMLLAKETLASFGSTGRGSPSNIKALHSVLPARGSFKFSCRYLLNAPLIAAMMASLKVHPCAVRTALIADVGTGGMRVKTRWPLYGKNGFLLAFEALHLSSASSFMSKIEKTPRRNICAALQTPAKHEIGPTHLFLGARSRGGAPEGGRARAACLPKSIAGNGIFCSTSPSSHFISGKKAKRSPKPSLMTWCTRKTTAERPCLALTSVTVHSGCVRSRGFAMTDCAYASTSASPTTSCSEKW
mmetsp:Transcript_5662/g.21443  ORF Transcript_5662/g.21443 Transcript_5662/m.21443 type:complete len:343 (+) Transcript_5662:330-1358(+)